MSIRDNLQRETGEWADSTFLSSSPETIRSHLREEFKEFLDEPINSAHIPEEAADILLLLMHLAHKQGWDLLDEGVRKLVKNKTRKWNTVAEPGGHFRHAE